MSKGLKDHEIAELVNALKEELRKFIPHQSLREMISRIVVGYLESKGLRIDKRG